MRKFHKVHNERGDRAILPVRSTANSAGYDIAIPEGITIPAHGVVMAGTGIKVQMDKEDTFLIANRSSSPRKGYVCPLGIGVIDSDYYDNPDNEGELFIILMSVDGKEHTLESGTRVAQGIFSTYSITDDDNADGLRVGGIGSTGV